ncbi:alpha/beta hydrolase, partial [Kineosporia mesophila]
MPLPLDPELAAVFAASAGDNPPAPLVPGDWKTWREAVAATYPLLTAGLDVPDVGHQVFTTTTEDGARIDLHWFTPVAERKTAEREAAEREAAEREATEREAAGPAALHAHGGGLVAGQVEHFAPFLARYVAASGVPILSVEYRLAPEVTGQTLTDDVYTGLTWLIDNAEELGVDPARIAVMGESAGATLAVTTAIRARDAGVRVARQILIYPLLDNRVVEPDPELGPASADMYALKVTAWQSVLGDGHADDAPATIVPARLKDHTGLPPAYLEVGELEILRQETIDYAQRLWAAGVSAELHVLPGLTHGWDHFAPAIGIHAGVHARRVAVLRS